MVHQSDAYRKREYAEGPATILAIGTANPPHIIYQDNYADYFFGITNSQDKIQLKDKFRRICEKTMIKKRHTLITEETLKQNPTLLSYTTSSFDARQAIVVDEIPKLAAAAATKAIKEWGQPPSSITHLVLSSLSGIDLPGADCCLLRLLGLPLSIERLTLYTVGCHTGGTVLRLAKDIAENNKNARVLVVSVELTVPFFRGPDAAHFENLIGQAIFGEGAAALIVGADPISVEKPIFELAAASQFTLPDCQEAVAGHLREVGLTMHLKSQLPGLVGENVEECLKRVLEPLEIPRGEWNSMFWAVHPGGRAILDKVQERLGLEEGKLEASRKVLREYGNMMSPSVLFILDELRKKSVAEGKATTGEGMEWGALLGFGPGVSVEAIVLRSVACMVGGA